jgi:hypothetical protein
VRNNPFTNCKPSIKSKQTLSLNDVLRWLHAWIKQFADPFTILRAFRGLSWYFADWFRYSRLPCSEIIRLMDTQPQLHDRTITTQIDPHYFFSLGWAVRRIQTKFPVMHVDVGSHNLFANLLSASIPVIFLDYRPLQIKLTGLISLRGSILELPFATGAIQSLSCLHVAEHIGLGRYGDPLDPNGTKKAVKEMERVLAPGGNLFLAIPVGQPRLCFNAHRIHGAEMIREIASRLELVEFSGVHDDGRFVERVSLNEFKDSSYACGMFWFRKTVSM